MTTIVSRGIPSSVDGMRTISGSGETSDSGWDSWQSLDGSGSISSIAAIIEESRKRVANGVGGFNPVPVVGGSSESSGKIAERSSSLLVNSLSGLGAVSGLVDGVGRDSGTTIISGSIPANLNRVSSNLRESDILRSSGNLSKSGSRSSIRCSITSSVEGNNMEIVCGSFIKTAEFMRGCISWLGDSRRICELGEGTLEDMISQKSQTTKISGFAPVESQAS
jgi:hypothetical protein